MLDENVKYSTARDPSSPVDYKCIRKTKFRPYSKIRSSSSSMTDETATLKVNIIKKIALLTTLSQT